MTCPRTFAAALAALVLCASAPAAAQCRNDRDCKGNRVCENNQCVEPGGTPPPPGAPTAGVAAAPAAPRPYEKGYGQVGAIMSFHGWGHASQSGGLGSGSSDISAGFWGGVQLAGYYVASPELHLGGYFTYFGGDASLGGSGGYGFDLYSLGVTGKLGKRVHERLWVGAAADLGVVFVNEKDASGTLYGLFLHPRVHADVLLVNEQGFKITLFGALGPTIIPYYGGTLSAFGGSADVHGWLIGLQMFLGLSMGI